MRQVPISILLIGISLLLLNFDNSNNLQNCKEYRIGTFYYHFNVDNGVRYYTVTRNDSMQIETNDDSGDIAKLKLHWIDPCTYEMRFIESTEILPKNLLDLKKTMLLKTSILYGTEKYYIFKATSNLSNHELQDTVWLTK